MIPIKFKDIFKIFIANKEIGESGTIHLQGYGELINPQTIKGLKKKLLELGQPRWHIEIAKGTLRRIYDILQKLSPLTI
jgi:hypothetical protein